MSRRHGRRLGVRERILETQNSLRLQAAQGQDVGRLDIVTNTFATKVVFADDDPRRAIGVDCEQGEGL